MRIVLNDLNPNTAYNLQLQTTLGDLVSDWSRVFTINVSADTIAPNQPTGAAVVVTGTSFDISWNAVTLSTDGSAAFDLDHYDLQIQNSGQTITRVFKLTDTKLNFSFEDNLATFGTPQATIRVQVRAVDKIGNASAYTTAIVSTNPTPGAPTSLVVTPMVDSIQATWVAPSDNDILEYRVYAGTTAGFTPTTPLWIGKTTAAVVPSTSYGADVYLKVATIDVFGTTSSYATSSAVRPKSTFGSDTTAPATPTGLAATLSTAADLQTTATVSWTAVTDTDNDLASYIVGYRKTADSDWNYVTVDYTNTSVKINGLIPYVNYDFRIRSQDFSANLSAWSSTVTTSTAATDTAPSQPSTPTVSSSLMRIMVTHDKQKQAGGALESDVVSLDVHASTTNGFTADATNKIGTIDIGPIAVGTFYLPTTSSTPAATTQTWYVKVFAVDRGGNKSTVSNQATATPGLIDSTSIVDATIGDAKIGNLAANKITAGTGFVNDITVKSTFTLGDASNNGTIKSFGYSAGVTGFSLAKTGLEINDGTIAAAALRIQSASENQMPLAYADFEFAPNYYATSMYAPANVTRTITAGGAKFNSQYMVARATTAAAFDLTLGSTLTDYNIPVDPNGAYIVSAWVKTGTVATSVTLKVKLSNASVSTIVTQALGASGSWQRISGTVTIPGSGVTAMQVLISSTTATTGAGVDIDGVQVETQMSGLTTPSSWTPPGSTFVDGGYIRTGEIRSNNTTTVNGVPQPNWSINMAGGAQFGDAAVRGKIIVGAVGADADAGQSFISSGNYAQGLTGWKIDSAGNAELNSGIFRGQLGVGVLTTNIVPDPGFEDPAPLTTNDATKWSEITASRTGSTTAAKSALGGHSGRYALQYKGNSSYRENLCANPNFVYDTIGWTTDSNATIVMATGAGLTGNALRVTVNSSNYANVYLNDIIPVVPGDEIFATARVKGPATRNYKMYARFLKADTTDVGGGWNNWREVTTGFTSDATASTWWELSAANLIAPANATGFLLLVQFAPTASAGDQYYLDNVIIEKKQASNYGRVNMCRNPSFETNLSDWNGTILNHTATRVASPAANYWGFGTSGFVMQMSASGTTQIYHRYTPNVPAQEAVPVTFSCYMASSSATVTQWHITVQAYNISNTLLNTTSGSNTQIDSTHAGRVSYSYTPPANTSYLLFYIETMSTPSAGGLYFVDRVLIEYQNTVGTYFDGGLTNPGPAGSTVRWNGQANLSPSVITYPFFAGDTADASGVKYGWSGPFARSPSWENIDGTRFASAIFPVIPNASYRVTASAAAGGHGGRFTVRLLTGATAGAVSTSNVISDIFEAGQPGYYTRTSTVGAGNYASPNGDVVVPSGHLFARIQIDVDGPGEIYFDDITMVQQGVGGATEITPAGVRLFSPDGDEVGAFVTNRPNSFSVTDNGQTLAAITTKGEVTAASLAVTANDISVGGTNLSYMLEQRAKGLITRTSFGGGSYTWTLNGGTETGICEVTWTAEAGRSYEIAVSPVQCVPASGNTIIRMAARYTLSASTAPTISSPMWRYADFVSPISGSGQHMPPFIFEFDTAATTTVVRMMITVQRVLGTGNPGISTSGVNPFSVNVYHTGLLPYATWNPNDGGSAQFGGGTTPPPATGTQQYTTTWISDNSRTWDGNGTSIRNTGGAVYQGYYSSLNGNQCGLWTFGFGATSGEVGAGLSSATSGATVTQVRAYMVNQHWFQGAGGTARIYVHGQNSVPSTFPESIALVQSSGWGNGAARWITLPGDIAFTIAGVNAGLYTHIAAGRVKGFGVGPAPNNTSEYYGYFNGGNGGAAFEITYTK